MAKDGSVQVENLSQSIRCKEHPVSQFYRLQHIEALHILAAIAAGVRALWCHCRSWLLRSLSY